MIRRQVGKEYWLISQHDHAKVSGELAGYIGNSRFRPILTPGAILGISLHDSGWPIHDSAPTLNDEGKPRDVFESTREIALPVWEASADQAAEQDTYAGLLVSLHGLALSVYATGASPLAGHRWDLTDPRGKFEVNRFQHRMIEMQEIARQALGMRTDRPLKHGLADDSIDDPKERELVFNFRWLQAMDQLSLAICCTKPPFPQLGPVYESAGAAGIHLNTQRPDARLLHVDPWPFDRDEISVIVPCRRVPAERFVTDDEFRAAYGGAIPEQFTVSLTPLTMTP